MSLNVTCPECKHSFEVSQATGPRAGSFTSTLREYMKANPSATRSEVMAHFRNFTLPSGELVSLSTLSTQYQVAHTLRKDGKL